LSCLSSSSSSVWQSPSPWRFITAPFFEIKISCGYVDFVNWTSGRIFFQRVPKKREAVKKVSVRTLKMLFWGILLQGNWSLRAYSLHNSLCNNVVSVQTTFDTVEFDVWHQCQCRWILACSGRPRLWSGHEGDKMVWHPPGSVHLPNFIVHFIHLSMNCNTEFFHYVWRWLIRE
jgi:hypothetical protein